MKLSDLIRTSDIKHPQGVCERCKYWYCQMCSNAREPMLFCSRSCMYQHDRALGLIKGRRKPFRVAVFTESDLDFLRACGVNVKEKS